MIQQCVFHEHPNTTLAYGNDTIINIPLPYDPNTLTEPDLWDSSFHPISLHGSMEHLALDTKNIKDLLNFMTKYISNKQVGLVRSNDLNDFKGIGKTLWNLISSVYQFRWDSLSTDKNTKSLREKISAKLTPGLFQLLAIVIKHQIRQLQLISKKYRPLFQPNCRKRLSRSLNFSRTSNLSNLSISHPPSYLCKTVLRLAHITWWM